MRTQDETGAAAVEFALVLPLLLLLVFGIVDFGRAYHAQVTLTHAAREGVRTLALASGTSTGKAALDKRLPPSAGADLRGAFEDPTIQRWAGCGDGVTTAAEADLGYELAELEFAESFEFITPLPGLAVFLGSSGWDSDATLTGEAAMRCRG